MAIGLLEILVSTWAPRFLLFIVPIHILGSYSIVIGLATFFTGLILYSLQWLVLRRYFLGMRWWVLAHVSASIVMISSGEMLERLGRAIVFLTGLWSKPTSMLDQYRYQFLVSSITSFLWAMICGIIGWRLFRNHIERASHWIWAKLGGALISTLITF